MKRFYEIDTVRGIAIILMVIYHFFFTLEFFGMLEASSIMFLHYSGRILGGVFILLVGVSLNISYSRVKKRSSKENIKKYTKRGLDIFLWGFLIILIVKTFVGQFPTFNILNLIGLSIIFAYPFLKLQRTNLVMGIILTITGIIISQIHIPFEWLALIGFKSGNYYFFGGNFPILPWFGIVLLGIYIGKKLYPNGKRAFKISEKENILIKLFSIAGRNSLFIFLVHIPINLIILNKMDMIQTLSFLAASIIYLMGHNQNLKTKALKSLKENI